MANIVTFTINAGEVEGATEISSVTSSSGSVGLSNSNTARLDEGDTVTYTYNGSSGSVSITSIDSSKWSASGTTVNSSTDVTLTALTGASAGIDRVNVEDDVFGVFATWIEHNGASYTAPTISGTTFLFYNGITNAAFSSGSQYVVQTRIDLSSNGSGGTLEYGRNTSSNNVSGATWQTSNTWNHAIGQTRYYWASQAKATSGAFDSTGAVTHSYVDPQSVSVSNASVDFGASSKTVTITGTTTDYGGVNNRAAEAYSISKTDFGAGEISASTVSADRVGVEFNPSSGTTVNFTIPNADLPANTGGATQTYYVYAYRRPDWCGKEVYYKTDSFVLTRSNAIAPANITCANQNIAFAATGPLSVAISGGITSDEAYTVSETSGLASANVVANSIDTIIPYDGSNFSIPNGNLPTVAQSPKTFYLYAARYPAANGDGFFDEVGSFTISRQAADRTPEGFTNLGGNKTNATPSTTYYATFSTSTVATGNASDAPGLSLGSTIDNGTSISVSNGEWSTNKTNWFTSSSTVNAAQVVYFRGTSASSGSRTHSLTIGTVTRSFTTNTGSGTVTVNMSFDPELGGYNTTISSGTGGGFSSNDARLITGGTTVTFNNTSDPGGPSTEFSSYAQWTNNSTVSISSGSSFTKTWASGVLGNTVDPIRFRTFFSGGNQDQFIYFRQPPVVPDLSVTPSNTTMAYNAGTVNVSVADVTSGEIYEVHEENNATSLGSATATGTSVTITATIGNNVANTSGNLSIGSTKTYEIYARRPTSIGGDGLADPTDDTFTIERLVEPLTNVNTITFSPASTASATTSVEVSATGGSGGTIQVRQGTSGAWSNAPASFSLTRGTPYTFQARRLGAQSANSTTPIQDNYTPPYLLPDLGVAGTSSTIPFVATSATTTVSGVARSTDTVAVRLNNGSTNLAAEDGNGDITFSSSLPSGGNTTTYELFTRRAVSTGGDGSTFYATDDTFTVTRTAQDTNPNAYSFNAVSDVARSTTQTSNSITITGITGTVNVSVTGGTYRKNGTGGFTSSAGQAVSGDTFEVQHTSSSAFSTSVSTTLTVGSGTNASETFTSTTLAEDSTPGEFTFNDVTGVAPSTTQTSNSITISDINTTVNVAVTGGTYRKNGTGGFTSSPGQAVNGDTFEVQHTSSANPLTSVNTTLTVGLESDIFTSTTRDITAPTANNVTVNNPESPTYTATFNLSNVGQDGTLQYAIEKNDSTPDNWTNAATDSTSTFTANFSRTSSPGTIYAQARRSASKTSSIVSVAGRGFIAPANITCSDQNIATTFTGDLSVAISGGISTKEAYTVSLTSGLASANVVANSIDTIVPYDGSNFSIPSANLPSNGNFTDYYLYAARYTTYGGSGTFSEVGSFRVTRASVVATPTNFSVTDVVGSEGTYTSSTGTTNNLAADSLAGHTLQFRVDSGTWSTTSSYAHNYGATRVYEARYVRNSDSEFSPTPASITRQVADAEITISPVTSILSTNSTNPLKIADISGATADTQYRVRATGNINGSSVTNSFIDAPVAINSTPDINAANPGELPAAGTSATYTVMARVGAIDDGDGLYRFLRTGISNRSWTLSRTAPGDSPDQFSFSAPTTNSNNINVTVTASYSGSTPSGTIQLSETSNFASTQANGSSFAFVRGTPKTIYARLSNGGEFSTPSSESHTPVYLSPQVNISAPTGFDSNLNFSESGNETVSITGGNIAGNNYRVRRTSPSVVQCGNTGELGASATGTVTVGDAADELPGSGEVFAYDVQAQKSVSTGGDGTSWSATGETFSIGRQNNWTFTSVPSATGGQEYIASEQVNGLVGTLSATKTSGSGDFAVTTGSSPTGATFNTSAKNIQNGNYIHARITASSTAGTTLTQTLSIDGQTSSFGVTTPTAGTGGSADYGLRIFNENAKLVLDTPDRTGQVVTSVSFTANGSTSDLTTNTTTTNLPASFDNFVTEDSEVVVISTGDPRRVRAQVIENVSSPKWAVKATVRGTSNQTLTAIVVSFGDLP